MRWRSMCCALALVAQPAMAESPKTVDDAPGIMGVGRELCSKLTPANETRMFDFVWGMWSGMNVAANTPQVGHTVKPNQILVDVVKACMAAPTLPIGLATLAIHMRYERDRR